MASKDSEQAGRGEDEFGGKCGKGACGHVPAFLGAGEKVIETGCPPHAE